VEICLICEAANHFVLDVNSLVTGFFSCPTFLAGQFATLFPFNLKLVKLQRNGSNFRGLMRKLQFQCSTVIFIQFDTIVMGFVLLFSEFFVQCGILNVSTGI
jgi:hypothetical protein